MKRLLSYAVLVAGVLAMTSSLALAQPDGQGRRGGRGGFFGFGLEGLIAMPEVQKELKLSDEDAAKITKKLEELRPARGTGAGFQDFQNLSQEERQKRMEEFRKQREESAKKVEEALKADLTADQFKRLNELRLQREGLGMSIERPEVADKLKLTSEQKEKVKTVIAANRPQFGRGGGQGGERPSREEMQQRREKFQADLMAVLTPEQKTAWENLQGAKFTFPERPPGGRGGNRPNRPATE